VNTSAIARRLAPVALVAGAGLLVVAEDPLPSAAAIVLLVAGVVLGCVALLTPEILLGGGDPDDRSPAPSGRRGDGDATGAGVRRPRRPRARLRRRR
jgi:hypothetical protein